MCCLSSILFESGFCCKLIHLCYLCLQNSGFNHVTTHTFHLYRFEYRVWDTISLYDFPKAPLVHGVKRLFDVHESNAYGYLQLHYLPYYISSSEAYLFVSQIVVNSILVLHIRTLHSEQTLE